MIQESIETNDKSAEQNTKQLKTSKFVIAIAVLLTVICTVLAFALAARKGFDMQSQVLGYTFGPIILGFVIVGLFQIGKRFRNQRSRWKTYSWVLFLSFLSNFSQIVQIASQSANA